MYSREGGRALLAKRGNIEDRMDIHHPRNRVALNKLLLFVEIGALGASVRVASA